MENLCDLKFHYAILPHLRISPLILYKVELRGRLETTYVCCYKVIWT